MHYAAMDAYCLIKLLLAVAKKVKAKDKSELGLENNVLALSYTKEDE